MKKKTMSRKEQDERLGELLKQTALGAELDALMAELVPVDSPWWASEGKTLDTDSTDADSAGVIHFRRIRASQTVSSEPAPVERRGTNEFRAAAASQGEDKPRALPKIAGRKTPLGEAKGAKGRCSFYAIGERVFVAVEGQPATRISLRGLPIETYVLSSVTDADGHYEIIGIKAAEVAQFLVLRGKPRW